MYLELADAPSNNILDYMVQVPDGQGGFIWVREDLLDDLSDQELYEILQMQPHLNGILSMFNNIRKRRQERKASNKQTRFDWREKKRAVRTDRKGGNILDRLTAGVGKVVQKLPGQNGQATAPAQTHSASDFFPQVTGNASIGVAKWWQNPMVMGVGAVVVIGGIYLITKKKK